MSKTYIVLRDQFGKSRGYIEKDSNKLYKLDELESRHDPETDELLGMLDILVDGRYDEKLRNLTLIYCGSENQRVIDMNKTRAARAGGDEGIIVPYKSSYDIEIKI